MRVTLLASLLISAALTGTPRVTVTRPQIAVVSLAAPAQLTFLGKRVAEAVAQVAERTGDFTVLGPEAVERALGRARTKKLIECSGLARCAGERAAALKVDRLISGVLAQTDRNYIVTLVLVDAGTGRQITSMTRDIPIATRRLLKDVATGTPALLRGEPDTVGTLMVLTDEPGAEAVVDEQWEGTTPFVLSVKPGKHQVQVRRDGCIEQEPHWVDVPSREVVRDRVKLYPIPKRDLPSRGGRSDR